MPSRLEASANGASDEPARRQADGWTCGGAQDTPNLIPNEPRTVRHPDPPVVWRLSFDPPLQPDWRALELAFGPAGVVDARLILIFADGTRMPQPFPKLGRNEFRALFRPFQPVARLDVPLHLELRAVSAGERRRALLKRALSVLRGDPRSFPWRLARVLVQLHRQGRSVIPPAPPTGSARDDYRVWRERFDERAEDIRLHRERASLLGRRVTFSLIADPESTVEDGEALLDSLSAQVYGGWELFTPYPSQTDARVHELEKLSGTWVEAVGSALNTASGDFVLLPRPGTRLRPHALSTFAAAAERWPDVELIYADDDDITGSDRQCPRFKPAWSPTRLAGSNYIGDLCCVALHRLRRSLDAVDPAALQHDLLLRTTSDLPSDAVLHVAQVLSHSKPLALQPPIRRAPCDAVKPLVSLIIPTRDRADLLRLSVGSIRAKTRYPNYEILVIDNGSREADTISLFKDMAQDTAIRVLPDAGPFNYAALNNRAVAAARGTLIGLVNNDVEVLEPHWLDEMVGWAVRPDIGCVGAKLFYPDGRLQHGGVVTGVAGAAGHRYKRASPDASSMLDELNVVHEVSAVTAACLVVRKVIFNEVGGLDETAFPVAYNDLDFCLRVLRAGYRNLWTPFATLVHHESVSRGRDLSPKTAERFNRENLILRLRWADRLLADPYYSPNLTLDEETGAVRTQ